MKNMIGTIALALLMATTGAEAKGRLVDGAELSPAIRASYAEEIAKARKTTPEAFKALEVLAGQADEIDAMRRGRSAGFSRYLKGLGDQLVWPVVEMLAFSAPVEGPTTPTASEGFDAGLIQAAGELRNPTLAPLWNAILDGGDERFLVVSSAVGALGLLETDEAAKKLVALSKSQGLRRDAALFAMGNCRRLVVARALAEALDAGPELAQLKQVTKSLGDVGSAAAWKTPAVSHRSEEGAVRRVAAESLVRAFVTHEHAEARQAASNALMRVDAPETPMLIQSARKGASPELNAALDSLQKRFDRNPAR